VGLNDKQAAEQIRADTIDILIDLSGHSSAHRLGLFAHEPAPLAMTWLGYPATTGLSRIDYVIADRRVLPPDVEPQFTERPLRLADSFLCFTPHDFEPPAFDTDGPVTFGSFNKTIKLSDSCVATWARILHRVPDSRLLLKDRRMADEKARTTLADRFAAHGVPAGRLTLLARTATRDEHFRLYGGMTMALDPFPYAGTTTTMEALTAGVPVLTLETGGFVSRVGASILGTAGLEDWIAGDLDDYVERAVALVETAREPGFRTELRQRVLASPLCNAPRFAHGLHAALHAAWRGDASFMPASD
jgi:predicted O-linked N-acetylglucosamine transferase (SPINDLY family)